MKALQTKPNEKRFAVYYPSVHGRRLIGTSNDLVKAITIGEMFGCRDMECPCVKYHIYDNKLKTECIKDVIKDCVEMDYKKG